MDIAKTNGLELEYEATGSGEPVLLISPVVADAFAPLISASQISNRYRLIRYHKRGWRGSTHTPPPVTIADHASDAAALLEYTGTKRAHVIGHSSGGAVALQLAMERPDMVHSLVLLEPSLFSVPGAADLFARVGPALEAYAAGDHSTAVTRFLAVVGGMEPDQCSAIIDKNVPGAIAHAIEDADTFFAVELPAISAWEFGAEQAGSIECPTLSVRGSETGQVWVEVALLLRGWLPQLEEVTLDGIGHLLQMQRPEPVVRAIAAFLGRHAIVEATTARRVHA